MHFVQQCCMFLNIHIKYLRFFCLFSLSAVWQGIFATAVSADKRSSRGVASANSLITVIEPASGLAGLNTSKNVVPLKLMAKHPMRASGKWGTAKRCCMMFDFDQ